MGRILLRFSGYKLDAAYTGKGYMTEAVRLVVEYAFTQLGLHRIEANVMPRNTASLRVVKKNGFRTPNPYTEIGKNIGTNHSFGSNHRL